MKFYYIFIIFLILGSCDTSEFETENSENYLNFAELRSSGCVEVTEDFCIVIGQVPLLTSGEVGSYHNDLLDYQLIEITEDSSLFESVVELLEYLSSVHNSYYNTINYPITVNYFGFDFVEPLNYEASGPSALYKEILQAYLEDLHAFCEDECSELELYDIIQSYTNQAFILELDVEREAMLSALSIALNSFEYWLENLDHYKIVVANWLQSTTTFMDDPVLVPYDINVKSMLWADAKGAAIGAFRGFFLAGGPAGSVSVGLASGAGASAVNLIEQSILGGCTGCP